MLPVVTLTLAKCKTSEKLSEKTSREKCQWPPPVKPFLFWGLSQCCPSSAPVVNFIVFELLKLINNLLCYLTDQINIIFNSLDDIF